MKQSLNELLKQYVAQTVNTQLLYNEHFETELIQLKNKIATLIKNEKPNLVERTLVKAIAPHRIQIKKMEYDLQLSIQTELKKSFGVNLKILGQPITGANAFLHQKSSSSIQLNIQIEQQIIHNSKK